MPDLTRSVIGRECDIKGVVSTEFNGGRRFILEAGTDAVINLAFYLDRSPTVDAGSKLLSVGSSYTILSGSLESATPVLIRYTQTNGAIATMDNIPLNAASPAFGLVTSPNQNVPIVAVTTPAFDNQAAGTTVIYQYQVQLVADADQDVELDWHASEITQNVNYTASGGGGGGGGGGGDSEIVEANVNVLTIGTTNVDLGDAVRAELFIDFPLLSLGDINESLTITSTAINATTTMIIYEMKDPDGGLETILAPAFYTASIDVGTNTATIAISISVGIPLTATCTLSIWIVA